MSGYKAAGPEPRTPGEPRNPGGQSDFWANARGRPSGVTIGAELPAQGVLVELEQDRVRAGLQLDGDAVLVGPESARG